MISLGYGKQIHPYTKEQFFHHGVDFKTDSYRLHAVATGVVTAVGTDAQHGAFLVIRYGSYDIKYGHLSTLAVSYGQAVKAGQAVAVSGDILHLEAKENGEEIDPIDFITALWQNVNEADNATHPEIQEHLDPGLPIQTHYEKDRDEIEGLMLRFLPAYLLDIWRGIYSPSERTELSLRNLFSVASQRNYYYETCPSLSNPLGLGNRSVPLIEKVQNLLIGDFLSYLRERHSLGLGAGESEKKK